MTRIQIGSPLTLRASALGLASALILAGCTSDNGKKGGTSAAGTSAGGTSASVGGGGTGGTAAVGGAAVGGAGAGGASVGGAGAGGGGGAMAGASGAGGSGGAAENFDPMMLSETGLYADTAAGTLAPGVMAFEPQYPLWSDGAVKKRWAYFPPGSKITTTNMDFWVYPVGTKFWKEFTRDGVRVETRILWKQVAGAAGWYMMAFQWNAAGTDAVATPDGADNASGTLHDIPNQEKCSSCHTSNDRAIGFSAVNLSHPHNAMNDDGVNMDDIVAMNLLTVPPVAPIVLPGDAVAQAAIGYMHTNCGMCHNEHSNVFNAKINDMDLWLHVTADPTCTVCGSLASVQETGAYIGLVNVDTKKGNILGATKRIVPGDLVHSAVYQVMNRRDAMGGAAVDAGAVDGGVVTVQMPPIGTEITDPTGLAAIAAWINQLP